MKKTLIYTLLACALLATSASAGTFKVPNDDFGIASVSIPDSWKPEAIDRGVQANSPDSEIYIAVEAVGSDKGIDSAIDETEKMLKENKVTIDESSQSKSTFKVAGVEATELDYKGKQDGEAQTVAIVLVPLKGKLVIMTYWATAAKEKAHEVEIGKIVNSLKAL